MDRGQRPSCYGKNETDVFHCLFIHTLAFPLSWKLFRPIKPVQHEAPKVYIYIYICVCFRFLYIYICASDFFFATFTECFLTDGRICHIVETNCQATSNRSVGLLTCFTRITLLIYWGYIKISYCITGYMLYINNNNCHHSDNMIFFYST